MQVNFSVQLSENGVGWRPSSMRRGTQLFWDGLWWGSCHSVMLPQDPFGQCESFMLAKHSQSSQTL